jgi:plasmid replication initiation protein
MTEVTLFKPNELIAAIDQIQVNRIAKHLCNYFLQYAQYKLKTDKNQGHQFELSISELNAEAQIGLKDYKLIEKSLNALMQPVTIRDKDDPRSYIKLVPIYLVIVDAKKGVYRFSLAPEVLEIIKNTDYFTKLNLHEFNFLQSKHSLVLYEWLKRYEKAPKIPQISTEELRQITGTVDKKTYDNFAQFSKWVIDVAVSEINEKTPYQVSYTTIKTKTSRRPKVTALQFEFKHKNTNTTPETPKVAKQDDWESDIIRCLQMRVPSDDMYETLCEKYITENFCSTKEEFYKATYDYQLKILERFYNEKKSYKHNPNKLQNWLYKDKNKKGLERQQYHYQYCHRLIDNVPECYQHYIYDAQKSMGMGSLIQKLRTLIGETSSIDLESYL